MAKTTPRGIQATSIRARIYEGVDKGLFERVGKGLYMVTRDNEDGSKTNCLLINGDGRDLSIFADDSIDCLLNDHPYLLKKSHVGGNRMLANYDCFRYNVQDFKDRYRILRPGGFMIEMLPERNSDNIEYINEIITMAQKCNYEETVAVGKSVVVEKPGFDFYAVVPWEKGSFVINQGRKAKNTEDIYFFTKGKARELKLDNKKNLMLAKEHCIKTSSNGSYDVAKALSDNGIAPQYMSGTNGMLPVTFNFSPPGKKERIHQAEKPTKLLEEILRFVTLPGETVLDQFAGSGVLGEAALNTGRNSVLIEKDEETFQKLTERLKALGNNQTLTPAAETLISIGKEAIVAQDAFQRTGDRNILYDFAKTHEIEPSVLFEGETDLRRDNHLSAEQENVISAAFSAIEEIDLRSDVLDLSPDNPRHSEGEESIASREADWPKVLECSSRGDRRFSALFAKVTIKGKEQSIEEWYQNSKRTSDGKRAGKGKAFDHLICPFTGDKLPASEASNFYKGLWITYLSKNPDLVAYAGEFDAFHDMFRGKNTVNCQADVIAAYVQNPDTFVDTVKHSFWYQNMVEKKKTSPVGQIQSGESRTACYAYVDPVVENQQKSVDNLIATAQKKASMQDVSAKHDFPEISL